VPDWDVRLDKVTKHYGRTVAVDRLTLEVRPGEVLSLLGPSGCGKTTTLRIIAGLVQPTEGAVAIKGRQVTSVPVHRRNIGMVFQNYALFPHLSVAENVAFGLRMRSTPRARIRPLVSEALDLVQLPGFEDRVPQQLSGGQQQRVALARALVIEPAVLLLDEPFGALDKKLREGMQIELRQLQQRLGITTIFVTHDQDEALTLSDTIAVMRHGRIEQQASPGQIYERPVSRFVADFIGASNFFHGRVQEAAGGGLEVTTREGVRLTARQPAEPLGAGDPVTIAVRPEKMRITPGSVAAGTPNATPARVEQVVYRGSVTHYHLRGPGGGVLMAAQQNTDGDRPIGALSVGEEVQVSWEATSTLVVRDE
jgi:putative spermidine/putrescine transport system ATP-binding protein/spermidine/putrescine transport system ATP-binding protein